MSWISTLNRKAPDKPSSQKKGRWFRLPPEKKRAIQDDVLRREEIRKELAKYTDTAISKRHNVHKRTVNKICNKANS